MFYYITCVIASSYLYTKLFIFPFDFPILLVAFLSITTKQSTSRKSDAAVVRNICLSLLMLPVKHQSVYA